VQEKASSLIVTEHTDSYLIKKLLKIPSFETGAFNTVNNYQTICKWCSSEGREIHLPVSVPSCHR